MILRWLDNSITLSDARKWRSTNPNSLCLPGHDGGGHSTWNMIASQGFTRELSADLTAPPLRPRAYRGYTHPEYNPESYFAGLAEHSKPLARHAGGCAVRGHLQTECAPNEDISNVHQDLGFIAHTAAERGASHTCALSLSPAGPLSSPSALSPAPTSALPHGSRSPSLPFAADAHADHVCVARRIADLTPTPDDVQELLACRVRSPAASLYTQRTDRGEPPAGAWAPLAACASRAKRRGHKASSPYAASYGHSWTESQTAHLVARREKLRGSATPLGSCSPGARPSCEPSPPTPTSTPPPSASPALDGAALDRCPGPRWVPMSERSPPTAGVSAPKAACSPGDHWCAHGDHEYEAGLQPLSMRPLAPAGRAASPRASARFEHGGARGAQRHGGVRKRITGAGSGQAGSWRRVLPRDAVLRKGKALARAALLASGLHKRRRPAVDWPLIDLLRFSMAANGSAGALDAVPDAPPSGPASGTAPCDVSLSPLVLHSAVLDPLDREAEADAPLYLDGAVASEVVM